jgi:energy-coupling factor transport system ATP-binding protein
MPLTLKNISYTYPEQAIKAIDQISLTIGNGEIIGVIGAIGAGKSTLAKTLNGLLLPDSGQIILDGEMLNTKTPDVKLWRKKVGLVFQYPEQQFFAETVREEITFAAKNQAYSQQTCDTLLKELMEHLDFLEDKDLERSPEEFSGGQKRFIAIASILIVNPEYLILDEPTVGLDFYHKKKLYSLLQDIQSKHKSAIIISHDLNFLSDLADKICVMTDGRIVKSGNPQKILTDRNLLMENNLTPSEITEIIFKLNQNDWNISNNLLSVKQISQEILTILKE